MNLKGCIALRHTLSSLWEGDEILSIIQLGLLIADIHVPLMYYQCILYTMDYKIGTSYFRIFDTSNTCPSIFIIILYDQYKT